jgi:hypothetical protein
MRKRKRLSLYLIWPFAVFFWIVGWGFYCIQNKRSAKLEKEKTVKQKMDFFAVLVPESHHEAQKVQKN